MLEKVINYSLDNDIIVNINSEILLKVTDNGICELVRFCPISHIIVSGIHSLTDKSVFALTNSCTSTLKEVYASACSKITIQAINYLKVNQRSII